MKPVVLDNFVQILQSVVLDLFCATFVQIFVPSCYENDIVKENYIVANLQIVSFDLFLNNMQTFVPVHFANSCLDQFAQLVIKGCKVLENTLYALRNYAICQVRC